MLEAATEAAERERTAGREKPLSAISPTQDPTHTPIKVPTPFPTKGAAKQREHDWPMSRAPSPSSRPASDPFPASSEVPTVGLTPCPSIAPTATPSEVPTVGPAPFPSATPSKIPPPSSEPGPDAHPDAAPDAALLGNPKPHQTWVPRSYADRVQRHR